jgi:hypothetical protein
MLYNMALRVKHVMTTTEKTISINSTNLVREGISKWRESNEYRPLTSYQIGLIVVAPADQVELKTLKDYSMVPTTNVKTWTAYYAQNRGDEGSIQALFEETMGTLTETTVTHLGNPGNSPRQSQDLDSET